MSSLRRLGARGIAVATVAAASALAGAPAARATTTSFANLAITDDARTDDASLFGRITTDMKVNVPAGFDWSNSAIEIVLTAGSVYNATNAVATESGPNPGFWGVPGFRNGQFDTFVASKNLTAATILGAFQSGADQPPPAQGLTTPNATAVRVSWGNTVGGEDGLFTVGRFTLSSNATGTFSGRTFATDNLGVPQNFSGTIVNGALSVPEPSCTAVAILGGAALTSRRRRRRIG